MPASTNQCFLESRFATEWYRYARFSILASNSDRAATASWKDSLRPNLRTEKLFATPLGQNTHRRRFSEKQQHLSCRDLSCGPSWPTKNWKNDAGRAHANTAETSGHNGAPMKHPAPLRRNAQLPCDDSSAGVRRAVHDMR